MTIEILTAQKITGEKRPRFTIITPNYNMGDYLASTIESVLQNLKPGDEYFIIDGGSSDSSVDVIRTYENRLTGWISERDKGYAEAISKGFHQAQGDYLCWVNSGDLLLNGALDNARVALETSGADLIFGDDLLIDDLNRILQVTNGHATNLRSMMLYAGWTPLQESCFWTRDIYERIGGIDSTIKYAADYDFFLRISMVGRCQYVPIIFGAFRKHAGQISITQRALYKDEREKCRARELAHLPKSPLNILISILYWFKVRWRVRILSKKRKMSHLEGKSVIGIFSQNA